MLYHTYKRTEDVYYILGMEEPRDASALAFLLENGEKDLVIPTNMRDKRIVYIERVTCAPSWSARLTNAAHKAVNKRFFELQGQIFWEDDDAGTTA